MPDRPPHPSADARPAHAPPGDVPPAVGGALRDRFVRLPEAIGAASGIRVLNRLVRSVLFSTDIALVRNTDADAVIAVYPFTPQPIITHALVGASDVPVFCGVGGGLTGGERTLAIARHAEFQGAHGVVVNQPTPNDLVTRLREVLEVPVFVTVVSPREDVVARVAAGADVLNVSGGKETPALVAHVRRLLPDVPILATGGPTDATVRAVLDAGANAVTYTPPTTAQLFQAVMERYRHALDGEG